MPCLPTSLSYYRSSYLPHKFASVSPRCAYLLYHLSYFTCFMDLHNFLSFFNYSSYLSHYHVHFPLIVSRLLYLSGLILHYLLYQFHTFITLHCSSLPNFTCLIAIHTCSRISSPFPHNLTVASPRYAPSCIALLSLLVHVPASLPPIYLHINSLTSSPL